MVKRDIVFSGDTVNKSRVADTPHRVSTILTERDLLTGKALAEEGSIEDVTFEDFVTFRQLGVADFTVKSHLRNDGEAKPPESDGNSITDEGAIRSRVRDMVMKRIDVTVARINITEESRLHFVLVFFEDGLKGSEGDLVEGNPQVVRRVICTGQFGFNTTAYLLGYSSLTLSLIHI